MDAEHVINEPIGADAGAGGLVAVVECVIHGGRVTGSAALGLGARVRVGGPMWDGRPSSCAVRTGFESLRVIGIANRRYGVDVGESGMQRGVVVGAPRPASVPPFESLRRTDATAPAARWGSRGSGGGWWWDRPARHPSGYRLPPVRRWGVFGPVGEEGDVPTPRPCPGFPLSRERRWGSAGRRRCWRWRGSFPLRRDGRFANRPYDALGESAVRRGGDVPPLDSRLRGGCGPSTGSGRTDEVGRPPNLTG